MALPAEPAGLPQAHIRASDNTSAVGLVRDLTWRATFSDGLL